MPSQEQINYLKKELAFLNLPEWWDKGWKGGGNHWDMESATSDHGDATENSIIYASPLAKVYMGGISGIFPNYTVVHEGITYTPEAFIVAKNIKFITRSIAGKAEDGLTPEAIYWINLRNKYNLILNNAAGNIGEKGASAAFPSASCYYWCADGLNESGQPTRDSYSSVDTENDFTMFTGFLEGTSFSSPMGDGLEDVICSRYGYDKTSDWMYSYLKMICMDLQAIGFDSYTGWGMPILPAAKRRLIEMTVGSKSYSVDNVDYLMDSTPITRTTTDTYGNKNLVVFVPVRVISEAFGKTIEGTVNSDKTVKVTITDSSKKVILNTGSITMLIYNLSGKLIDTRLLEYAPFIDEYNRTQVPIRAVSEAFGSKVGWVQSSKCVMILE